VNRGRRPLSIRRGLTLVDATISLAICAMLLTAVAWAYSASSSAIERNDEFFRASNAARVSLQQILSEVRRCQTMSFNPATPERLNVVTAAGAEYTYRYDSASRTLLLVNNDDPTDLGHAMARDITALSFSGDSSSICLTLTVSINGTPVTLSGSAVPRRKVTYQY